MSCGARLAVFDIAELREITAYDELELDTLGDRRTALFLIMSDTDDSFNFLISMCYTQLFNLLCEKADDVYGGRLPVHVRCLIDECANIGQIPKLEKLVATIRSREISACLVLQAQSQLKAIYKDNADTIIGNMDTSIFLGGKEPTTLKELAAVLGKETIDTYNVGESRGRETSHSLNYQKLGKEQPVREDVTFPMPHPIAGQIVIAVFLRQRLTHRQQRHDLLQQFDFQAALDGPLVVLLKAGCVLDAVLCFPHFFRSANNSSRSL